MKAISYLAAMVLLSQPAAAFGPFSFAPTRATANTASNAVVEEALSIYQKKYPKKGEYKAPFFNTWGVPKADVDGTPVFSEKTTEDKKRIFEIDVSLLKSNFQELAKVYGADEALQMTKDLPACLAFDKRNFKPSLVEFGKIFGEEEAKEMVMRNPGLLAIKPEDAAKSDDQTMKFSYVIAKTRPAGPFLLYGTLGLLSIPVIEGITGVPFRANLLNSVLN